MVLGCRVQGSMVLGCRVQGLGLRAFRVACTAAEDGAPILRASCCFGPESLNPKP